MSAIADRLGIPQYQTVVLKSGSVFKELIPRPKVMTMTKQDIVNFMANQVDINQEDLWVEGIPRTYTPDELAKGILILNAQPTQDGSWVGINTQVLWVDRNQLLTHRALVRKFRGR
jgi:hypothetical protein